MAKKDNIDLTPEDSWFNPEHGCSTAALRSNNAPANLAEMSLESLIDFSNKLMKGEDISPHVIQVSDGKPVLVKLEADENGIFQLPEIRQISDQEFATKKKLVKKIIEHIGPTIKADIESITYIALLRKDESKLRDIVEKFKGPDKPKYKLENRVGCIWIVFEDGWEFVI